MEEFWLRVMDNMSSRMSGPLNLRLIVQPVMAMVFAVIPGLKDAKLGKQPHFSALASTPGRRPDMIKDGWKSVGKIFILAVVLDTIFQVQALRTVFPGGVIFVASVLAIVPNLIVRGLVTRFAQRR